MAKKELTFSNHLIREDKTVVNIKDLPAEERKALARNFGKRMADTFSEYYSHHPEEFAALSSHKQNSQASAPS